MAQVTLTINDRQYDVRCDDGQEGHLLELAAFVDERAGTLIRSIGQVGDTRLLLMVSLLIADELAELRAAGSSRPPSEASLLQAPTIEDGLCAAVETLADRIERIAERLNAP